MPSRILVALVLAISVGCNGSSTSSDPHDGSTTLLRPEILAVNDYSRSRRLLTTTEQDTGELFNVAANRFSSSSSLAEHNLQVILLGQRTLRTEGEDIPHTVRSDGSVDYDELLLAVAAMRSEKLLGPLSSANDAVVLLTDLDDIHRRKEVAFPGFMCSADASVAVVNTGYASDVDSTSIARALGRLVGMCVDPPGPRSPYLCQQLSASIEAACAGGGFIMAASPDARSPGTQFSTCSARDFDSWVARKGPGNCMTNLVIQGSVAPDP